MVKEVTEDTDIIFRGDETEGVVPVRGESPTAGGNEAHTAPAAVHGNPSGSPSAPSAITKPPDAEPAPGTPKVREHPVDKLVERRAAENRQVQDEWEYGFHWFRYAPRDDTCESTSSSPRQFIRTFCRRRKLLIPGDIHHSRDEWQPAARHPPSFHFWRPLSFPSHYSLSLFLPIPSTCC